MRLAIRFMVVFFAAVLLTGCPATVYINRIEQTPENLQAFRECQQTFVVAVGYDAESYFQMKRSCLSTIRWTTEPFLSPDGTMPDPPPGCQRLEQVQEQLYVICP
jgi:hypothetical protein